MPTWEMCVGDAMERMGVTKDDVDYDSIVGRQPGEGW